MIEVTTEDIVVDIVNDIDVSSTGNIDVVVEDNNELDITVAKKEFVITGDNIYVPVLYDDVPQWMKDLVSLSVNQAIEGVSTSNLDQLNSMLAEFATSYVPLNQYTESILDLSNADISLHALIETLNSTYEDGINSANSQIITLESTKASKDEVVTQVIETINAQLIDGTSDIGATIARLDQAIVNSNQSSALSYQALVASIDSLGDGLAGNAAAINTVGSYVGVVDGVVTGTGLLADVAILQKQNDGIIETTSGTYKVMLNPQDPNTAQLVTTAEPYVSWKASESAGSIDKRLAHIGDVYIEYVSNPNGMKEYVASYKFIRTVVDNTSPYATDSDGFTWALIVDQAAQDAYQQALNAYELADSKMAIRYGTAVQRDATSSGWTTQQKIDNVGDIWILSDVGVDENKQFRWTGTAWADIRDKKIIANASAITQLQADVVSEAGLRASGDTAVTNTVKAYADGVGAGVETKWAYNSIVNIGGIYKKSGFGLTTNYTSGNGTEANPYASEFWIDASRMKFTNSAMTGSKAPFTIDATGLVPEITFNGKVAFTNVTGYTPPDIEGSIYTNNDIFAQKLGYANYSDMVTAANNGQTIINGGYINTGLLQANSILANQINATGLIAENISGNIISGKKISGGVIEGASIQGVTISASYLDLDRQLQVLTNYYLCVGGNTTGVPTDAINEGRYETYSGVPGDSVPSTEYGNLRRIPSISIIYEESFWGNLNYAGAQYNSKIKSLKNYTAGHNIKCKRHVVPVNISSNIMLFRMASSDTDKWVLANVDGTHSYNYSLYVGETLLGVLTLKGEYIGEVSSGDGSMSGYGFRVYLNGNKMTSSQTLNVNGLSISLNLTNLSVNQFPGSNVIEVVINPQNANVYFAHSTISLLRIVASGTNTLVNANTWNGPVTYDMSGGCSTALSVNNMI